MTDKFDLIADEILRLDGKKIQYAKYSLIPLQYNGQFKIKILDGRKVIAETILTDNIGQAQIQAKKIIRRLEGLDMSGFDMMASEIKKLPKHAPVQLAPDETTIKKMAKHLGISVSMAKKRLDTLVDAGKVKRSKRSNTYIYKWVG